jgi:hypothetical protein
MRHAQQMKLVRFIPASWISTPKQIIPLLQPTLPPQPLAHSAGARGDTATAFLRWLLRVSLAIAAGFAACPLLTI